MIGTYKLELITVLAILGFIAIFLFVSSGGNHEFSGSDDIGSQKISELTGKPVESYQPLIPQYEPPSAEIEATLFALQSAFGALVLGFIFGYWLGQRKSSQTT
ncbi:MAG: cobalt transport protein CbiN [Methanospirillum sp.]|uniref:energy-coupling factor ABC transporter substrate-binding protein n=1 Tax=Methanospirillum sp. TaxID=45200 RepID=UPI00236AEAD2|nr:cobalt transport protein CbiN [Methanospirillum sp.]MDD1728038.1 cobalt transport protein CbiN [Methanospirillum sp.]